MAAAFAPASAAAVVEHVGFTSEERSIIAAGLAAVVENTGRLAAAIE